MSEGFWSTVRESLSGSEQDFTTLPIRRAVLLLSIPMVLEMSMESLFAVVDIFYVSKLGANAVATVGMTEGVLSLVYALAMGLAAAATATVARKVGEKDITGARNAAGQVVLVSLVVSTVVAIAGATFARPMLGLMGASDETVATGWAYPAIMFGGNATIFLLFVINAIFRSAGDPAISMRTLWLANGLNMAIAPCLVFGVGPIPRLGVAGAAVATTASRAIGVAYQVWRLRRPGRIQLTLRDLAPRLDVCRDLFRLAATASFQVLIETASWLGLVRIIALYGSIALAGYTIAMRVAIFALLPAWGLANAAATLVGQNLGAKAPERARHSVKTVARYNMFFLGSISLVFVVIPGTVIGVFTSDAGAIAYGADALRIVSLGFVAFAFGMVNIQAFNGAGDTVTPMFVNLVCFWLVKIPVAYVLARIIGLGPHGVFIAVTVAYTIQAIVSTALFRRGSWENRSPTAPTP